MALRGKITGTGRRAAAPALLHVTDCLPFTGNREDPALQAAIERGTAVHLLTEAHDRGDDIPLDHPYLSWLMGWQAYLRDTNAEILKVERKVEHHRYGYCGTMDRLVMIGGQTWVIDIKTGPPWWTHGMQTAAYAEAWRTMCGGKRAWKIRRACVHLQPGKYTVHEHKGVHDLNDFLAHLRVKRLWIEAGVCEAPKER